MPNFYIKKRYLIIFARVFSFLLLAINFTGCSTSYKGGNNLEKKHTMSKSKFFAEITREAIFRFTNQEIPYQTNVITQKIIKTKSVKIYQNLVVKNKNQQRIIIGKSGKMLKLIGQYSRKQLEEILKSKVHLFLNVIVGN